MAASARRYPAVSPPGNRPGSWPSGWADPLRPSPARSPATAAGTATEPPRPMQPPTNAGADPSRPSSPNGLLCAPWWRSSLLCAGRPSRSQDGCDDSFLVTPPCRSRTKRSTSRSTIPAAPGDRPQPHPEAAVRQAHAVRRSPAGPPGGASSAAWCPSPPAPPRSKTARSRADAHSAGALVTFRPSSSGTLDGCTRSDVCRPKRCLPDTLPPRKPDDRRSGRSLCRVRPPRPGPGPSWRQLHVRPRLGGEKNPAGPESHTYAGEPFAQIRPSSSRSSSRSRLTWSSS